jgi:hypothetical protein
MASRAAGNWMRRNIGVSPVSSIVTGGAERAGVGQTFLAAPGSRLSSIGSVHVRTESK